MATSRSSRKGKGKGKKKSTVISVDMTDVESGGNMLKEEGDFLLTVDGVPEVKESDSGNEYVNFKFATEDGKVVYHTCSLQAHALWNLRNTLEALGMEVPQSSMDVDLEELDELQMMASCEIEKYQGKKKSVIVDMWPVDGEQEEEEEEDEEEEKPKKGKGKSSGKKGKKKDEDEEEDEEDEEEQPKKGKGKGKGKKTKVKVGSNVVFEDDGEEYEGEVTDITDGIYTVLVDDDEEWELEEEDLELAD